MSTIGQLMNHEETGRRHSFGIIPTAASTNTLSGASLQLSRAASMSASIFHRSSLSKIGNSMTAGGPIRRSHSKNSLFNEEVIEVSILRSPAQKTPVRTPYTHGLVTEGVHTYSPAQQNQQVTILDDLLGRELVFNVNQSHTVGCLKTRIQSRQGQDGLRIIPAHIQRLTFQGQECHDEEQVAPSLGRPQMLSRIASWRPFLRHL